jgi:uncharacterized membrane protein
LEVLLEIFSIFTAFGLAASAGLNAYIPLLAVALLAKFTNLIQLGPTWQNTLTSWWIIGLLIILTIIEFFADKIPVVNHINDIIMTIIRPFAGAIVFAAVTSHSIIKVNQIFALAMGILLAGSVHAVKAAVVRPVVTAATGTAGNIPVSIAEDGVCTVVSVTAILMPILVIFLLIGLIILTIFIIRKLIKKKREKDNANRIKLK